MKQDNNLWIKKTFMIALCLLILSSTVIALGVAPSRKVIDYSTEEQIIKFRIVNNDNRDMKLLVYAQGEYFDYVTIEKSTVYINKSEAEKEISYKIKLPAGLTPGTKNIDIIVMEVPLNLEVPENTQTVVLSTLSVTHQLRVNVPYPGVFAEGTLYITEGDVNDTITFTANILNMGTAQIKEAYGELVIKGPTNEELVRIKSSTIQNLNSQNSDKLIANWVADANPGVYYAEFIIHYDGQQLVLRKTFMIGQYYIEIKNIKVDQFRLGTIAKFDVELLNRWNQPVDNVYADMQVLDNKGGIIAMFKTAPASIDSLDTSTIIGYWDTKDVAVGTYDVKVILNYAGKASEKVFKTVVGIDSVVIQDFATLGKVIESPGKGDKLSLLYILVIVSIIFNVALFIYFKFMRKKE